MLKNIIEKISSLPILRRGPPAVPSYLFVVVRDFAQGGQLPFSGFGGVHVCDKLEEIRHLSHRERSKCQGCDVLHPLYMPRCNAVMPVIFRSSYGTHILLNLGETIEKGINGGE